MTSTNSSQSTNLTDKSRSELMRKTRCCFTGHRPQGLKRPIDDIKVDLENSILSAINEGYTTFISGLAYGVDIWAAETVIRLKDRFNNLHLIAAVPFPDFAEEWTQDWQARYKRLLSASEYVKYLEPKYTSESYQERNIWMVNHASMVIAVYNGRASGTRNTINYAKQCRIPIKYLSA